MLAAVLAFLVATANADWAWIAGTDGLNLYPTFSGLYAEAPSNTPGGLGGSSFAVNESFVYFFGGHIIGKTNMNFLLRLNTKNRRWAAMSLPSESTSVFGTKGVFSSSVHPVGKAGSGMFFDKSLNSLFIYAGIIDEEVSDNTVFEFNFDLLMWRWRHGPSSALEPGNYGQLGVESPSNLPPSRGYFAYFYDEASKKAYVQGGSAPAGGSYADIWVYSVTNNTWTWIHGVRGINAVSVYGETGKASNIARPGARFGASYAFDETKRRFYLYSGWGVAGPGQNTTEGFVVDFWQYEPDRNMWTFLQGFKDIGLRSNYTTKGVAQEGIFPQGRFIGSMVVDPSSQKLFVFGGVNDDYGFDTLNDLWSFDLNSQLWTWISGASTVNPRGRYGVLGVSSPLNNPRGRGWSMLFFLNGTREMMLYGGFNAGFLADLWSFSVSDLDFGRATTTATITARQMATSISVTNDQNSTLRTTPAQRRDVPASTGSSSVSAQLVGIFVSLLLLIVGVVAIVFACVRSRNLNQKANIVVDDEKPEVVTSVYSAAMSTAVSSAKSASEDITMSPTTIGLSLPADLEVSEVDFRYGQPLASGGNGDIFYGEAVSEELLERSRLIVIKRLKNANEWSLKLFEQEISVMYLLLSSQFVAKLVGFRIQPPVLLMKMYSDGSLLSFITKNTHGRKLKLKFSLDVARGLLDIHKAQIAHCDIKPQNVLIDRYANGKPFCVITDFGIAQVLSEKLLVVKYTQAISVKGLSVHYAAPEVFKRFRNQLELKTPEGLKSSDLFALAMSIFFVLCRKESWNT